MTLLEESLKEEIRCRRMLGIAGFVIWLLAVSCMLKYLFLGCGWV